MTVVLYTVFAFVLYVAGGLILEQYFSKFNTPTVLIWTYIFNFPLILALYAYLALPKKERFFLPSENLILVVCLYVLVIAVANFCYISAFTGGGNIITIATIMIMSPLFATIGKFLMTKDFTINKYQIGAWVLAAGVVYFSVLGEELNKRNGQ